MIKNSIIVIVVAAVLYAWWTYPLAALRGGEEISQNIESIESEIEETKQIIEEQEQLIAKFEAETGLTVSDVERKIEKYENSFFWFGDPTQENESKRYASAACKYIRNYLSLSLNDELEVLAYLESLSLNDELEVDELEVLAYLESLSLNDEWDHITTFVCNIGEPQPFQLNIDKLLLSLNIGTACKGDAERLVLAVDKHPAMLILLISASSETSANNNQQNGVKLTREDVALEIEFYVLSTPPDDVLEAAEKETQKQALEFDIGQTRQELLEDALRPQHEETDLIDTTSSAFVCPTN